MEAWSEIKGFESYEMSSFGNVKNGRGKILKPSANATGYLQAALFWNGKRKTLCVHKLVAEAFIENELELEHVDHIDGDKLNNNVSNLRYCTLSQNQGNRRKQTKPTTSQYKGVSWNIGANKWLAQLQVKPVRKHLGLFDSEEDAAKAYDVAATEFWKDFKHLNFEA